MALAEGAGLLVVGFSERWRHEGLGQVRAEIARRPLRRPCSSAAVSGLAGSRRAEPHALHLVADLGGRAMSGFVGAKTLAALTAALDDAFAGHGRLFLISGEPGIGKSRLAEASAAVRGNAGRPCLSAGAGRPVGRHRSGRGTGDPSSRLREA